MKLLTFLFYCLLLGIFGQSYSYITNVITWEKDGQKVFGCGDVHNYHQLYDNVFQRKFLDDNLGLLNPQNTCFLVEDVKAYKGSDSSVAEYVESRPVMMPQDGLIALVQHRTPKLETVNLEYRYARSAALLQFIQHDEDTLIKARDVVQEFDAMASLVRSYDDGEQLTKLYQEHVAAVNDKNGLMLDAIRQFPGPLTSWIRSQVRSSEKQVIFAQRLRLWDARLLDLKAIHEVVRCSKMRKILIFAGALHIFNIGRVLENLLGYKRNSTFGIDRETQYSQSSLDFDTLRPYVPAEKVFSHFTPLPAEQLKVLFE